MAKTVEFFFDVGSPASYLAWTQLPGLCEQAGARLVFKPMLLGGVFQATGNASPGAVPAKGRYVSLDLERFARRYNVPLRHNPHFPIMTLPFMRGAIAAQMRQPALFDTYLATVFKAIWVDGLNLNDPALAARTLAQAGFAPDLLQAWLNDPEVKAALKANTDEAVRRGVFGAPTMFVGDEMYFGQDRLDFLREALG